MKIHILSDLHTENYDYKYKRLDADIVVLAGDICNFEPKNEIYFYHFIQDIIYMNKNLKYILFVPGNHEYYNSEFNKVNEKLDMLEKCTKFINLNNKSIIIDNIRFVGTTLWSDTSSIQDYISNFNNDYKYINIKDIREVKDTDKITDKITEKKNVQESVRLFTTKDSQTLYIKSVEYLKNTLKEPFQGKTIVITHFLPSFKSIHYKYMNYGQIIKTFASDLDYIIKDYKPNIWIHGHTHCSLDYKIENTRVICNPRGHAYNDKYENIDFNDSLVIDTDIEN